MKNETRNVDSKLNMLKERVCDIKSIWEVSVDANNILKRAK